ncbi:hypothetical protein [Antribacter gilvus]|uniref:hypothetical protein n=1 Tax=Antribacter gilvus TaxID=2304675 RepID=UPI0013E00E2F|nr:hypothetical protein [Antribacter gilvus]
MSRDKDAKKYMNAHPEVRYVDALRIVRAERQAAWAARQAPEPDPGQDPDGEE